MFIGWMIEQIYQNKAIYRNLHMPFYLTLFKVKRFDVLVMQLPPTIGIFVCVVMKSHMTRIKRKLHENVYKIIITNVNLLITIFPSSQLRTDTSRNINANSFFQTVA